MARIAVITIEAGRRAQREGQQRAADQMAAGAVANGKVDHLGGENKRPHDAHQRNFVVVEFPLRAPRQIQRRTAARRRPSCPRPECSEIRRVYACGRFHGSTFFGIVRRDGAALPKMYA